MTKNLFAAFLCSAALVSSTLVAQIDRESATLVDCVRLRDASLAEVQTWSAQGYRMSNFEFNQLPPNPTMHVTMIRNSGEYAAGWYYYQDKTRAELLALCNTNNARIVDLERYIGNGVEQFAALLFVNAGQQAKAWHWFDVAQGAVASTVSNAGDRPIDIEPYSLNGQQRYHVITIANSGPDQMPWWVYTDTSTTAVQGYMSQHNARLYALGLENFLPGSVCAILVRDGLRSLTVWDNYWPSFDADTQNGGRLTGVFRANLTGFAMTLLDNMNPFATSGFASFGTNGLTLQSAEGNAFTGTTVTYRCENFRPWAPTFIAYGFTAQTVSLAPLGAPGCYALLDPVATELRFANGSGVATDTLAIPLNPAFAGAQLLTEFIGVDPGVNALGIQTSKRLRTTIRHW